VLTLSEACLAVVWLLLLLLLLRLISTGDDNIFNIQASLSVWPKALNNVLMFVKD
jgi:hypothetical protein